MSKILKRISPSYLPIFDTSLQRDIFLSSPDRDLSLMLIKWALLFSRHLYLPENIIVDHRIIRELLNEKDFQSLLTVEDLDGYPPIVTCLRNNAATILETTQDMLSYKMHWSSLPNVNRAQKKRKR
jgi:hypothetical protein